MAKANQDANSGAEPAAASFEASIDELQRIVDVLEDGSVGLEESMKEFEQGIRLLRNCYRILEQAEQKIQILTGINAQGEPIVADFDASATATPAAKPGRRKRNAAPAPAATTPELPCDEEEADGTTLF